MSKIKPELLTSFRRSAALQRIVADEHILRLVVKHDPRKIIPVAEVARWLEVSNRQLWKWINMGWISTYRRPANIYCKGISKTTFSRFLTRLLEYHSVARWIISPVRRGRPAKAQRRLSEAYQSKQLVDGMSPMECASELNISTDSVIRAMRQGTVPSFKLSPSRYRLGQRRKISRPKRKSN